MYDFRVDHLVLYNQLDLSLQKTNYLLHVEEIYTNNKERETVPLKTSMGIRRVGG